MYTCETLIDLIASRKDEKQKKINFVLGEVGEQLVSYKELYYGALDLLYNLRSAGFNKGDEVFLQIDNKQEFVFAFWACILGGMSPIPVTTGTND
jgi:polyketide synthase PksJ